MQTAVPAPEVWLSQQKTLGAVPFGSLMTHQQSPCERAVCHRNLNADVLTSNTVFTVDVLIFLEKKNHKLSMIKVYVLRFKRKSNIYSAYTVNYLFLLLPKQ